LNKNQLETNNTIEAWGSTPETRLDASADRNRGCGTTTKKKNFVAIPWRTRLLLVRQTAGRSFLKSNRIGYNLLFVWERKIFKRNKKKCRVEL